MVFAGLWQFNVKTIQTPKTSMDLAGLASSRGPRDVQTVTYAMAREARRISFSLNYANYAGIFNHRSMEEDKLFVLDKCGAYGQKDIEILYRSELARLSGVGRVLARKSFETPRSDQFNIKKVGIQTNKPLNWQHGGYTCIDIICINRCFIPVATKDKLSILDVWGAYGQKDIKILDRSEINKPE